MRQLLFCAFLIASVHLVQGQESTALWHNGIVVCGVEDTDKVTGTDLGPVKTRDRAFSGACTYAEVLDRVVDVAKTMGANLVRITRHKYPEIWNNCHRLEAEAYTVADPDSYVRLIDWSASRKLKVADFKGKPDDTYASNVVALTQCGFGVETNKVTMFQSPRYFVFCRFFCHDSWMKLSGRDDPKVLQHEQTHFDLDEVYARKLLQALLLARLNAGSLDRVNDIYGKIYDAYIIRQKQYDLETHHGTDDSEQEHWNKLIASELNELEEFSTEK